MNIWLPFKVFRIFGGTLVTCLVFSSLANADSCEVARDGTRFCAQPTRIPAASLAEEVCEMKTFGGGMTCKRKEETGYCHYDGAMEHCRGRAEGKEGQYCFFNGMTESCLDRKPSQQLAE